MLGFTLYLDNGVEEVEINETTGLIIQSISTDFPQQYLETTQISGVDGITITSSGYGSKNIYVKAFFKGYDLTDYDLMLLDIERQFYIQDEYYIRSSRNPSIRWLVRPKTTTSNLFAINGEFTFEFEAIRGHGESIGTTLSPQTYDSELWQLGQGLPNGIDLIYTHTTSSFSLLNAGTLEIDPRKHHLLDISIKCVGSPQIKNKTTGDVFKYNKTLKLSDTLLLTGVYPMLNGVHCGRDTNHGLIRLVSNWNDIEVTGCSNLTVTFNFRYLYK